MVATSEKNETFDFRYWISDGVRRIARRNLIGKIESKIQNPKFKIFTSLPSSACRYRAGCDSNCRNPNRNPRRIHREYQSQRIRMAFPWRMESFSAGAHRRARSWDDAAQST